MATLQIGPSDSIYYELTAPSRDDGCTFVFFNALTGDVGAWRPVIEPALIRAGHGALVYNMRGQTNSAFSPDVKLGQDLIVDDAIRLLEHVKPVRPVFVGLSIGGLFAARANLSGAQALGLVLINTLRKDGPRLKWIGDALVRTAVVGGLDLFRDLFMPVLMNEEWLQANRPSFIKPDPSYAALSPESGHYKLLAEAGRESDWDLPYEKLDVPTLVITGLQDHLFLELAVVNELFARLPKGRRIDMPDAGHLIPGERPDALARELSDFVKEL